MIQTNKNKIISEIKRTADANNGVPLGTQKFYIATGIKVSDWSGKFWTKWGDAVQEAGYLPNKMQEAFSDEFLLEKYAQLASELQHLPTSPELRLKARNDPSFPSNNTFSRLGTKQQITGKLLSYCKEEQTYNDLIAVLEVLPRTEVTSTDKTPSSNLEDGYVYLLIFGQEYKIGCSNNVERRFRELKTQMPYDGKILHSISTGDPEGIEAYWHKYFKDKRLKGEWFKLSTDDVRYFMKRKLM